MSEKNTTIGCPTFQQQEPTIEDITAAINTAEDILEETECAQRLQKEVDVFVSCTDYDENSADCRNCRLIATARGKTAGLILKAAKLA